MEYEAKSLKIKNLGHDHQFSLIYKSIINEMINISICDANEMRNIQENV